jgi:hypothetical protein
MKSYAFSRKDENHTAIVHCLQKLGATVFDLSALGESAPDIAIGFRDVTYLAEIKSGKKKLRPGQLALKIWWRGSKIYTLRDELDCMSLLFNKGKP